MQSTLALSKTEERQYAPNSTSAWKWSAFLAVVIALLMFRTIAVNINRDFDPEVEGFCLLSYENPHIYPMFSSFHLLLSKIPHIVACEIVHYRLLEFAIRVVPPIMLALSFSNWVKVQVTDLSRAQIILATASTAIGAMMCSSLAPFSTGYNALTIGLLTLSAAGTFLASSLKDSKSTWVRMIILVTTGFAAGLTFFVKFTSAICIIPVLAAFIYLQNRRWLDVLILFLGIFSAIAYFFGCVQNPQEWWRAFSEAIQAESTTDHKLGYILPRTIDAVRSHSLELIAFTSAFGAGTFILLKKPFSERKLFLVAVFLFGVAVSFLSLRHWFCSKELLIPLTASAIFAPFVIDDRKRMLRSPIFFGMTILLVLPLIASIGTNCGYLAHMSTHDGTLFLAATFASFLFCKFKLPAPYLVSVVPAVMLLGTYSAFLDNIKLQTTQKSDFAAAPLSSPLYGLKVTPEQDAFFVNASKLLRANGFKNNDIILGPYDCPGFTYLMHGVSPGQAWYVSWPERDLLNAQYLSKASLNRQSRLFVVLSTNDKNRLLRSQMRRTLERQGIAFPDSFDAIGELPSPLKPGATAYFYKLKTKLN